MATFKKNFFPSAAASLNGKTRNARISKYNFDMLIEYSDPKIDKAGDWLEFASTLNGDTLEHVRRTAYLATSAANIYMKRSLATGSTKFVEFRITVRSHTVYDAAGNAGREVGAALIPR